MKNTTRNTLLITAAVTALVAGAGLASAQGMNDRREAPAAPTQVPDKAKPAPGAQAPDKAKPAPSAQAPDKAAPDKAKPAPSAQAPDKAAPDKAKPVPSAQAPDKAAPDKAKPVPSAQAPDKAKPAQTTGQGGAAQPSQAPAQGAAPGVAGGEKAAAPAALSTEQHVKIRQTVRGEKAERLTNVQFSITVGEAVPRTVHRYRFPVSIMEYAPQYRDYEYILVGDQILVVDPRTLRIVAVIPA
jgi:Protein of unknown function (DUF1236)